MIKKAIIFGKEVEYDDTEFKVVPNTILLEELDNIPEYLQYIGDGVNIRNPKGNIIAVGMFQGYEGERIDLSNFDSKEIIRMDYMFAYSKLRIFSTEFLDTRNVKSVQGMFEGCTDLLLVDMGTCPSDFSRITDYSNFCADCSSLISVLLGFVEIGEDVDVVLCVDDMFINCVSLMIVNLPVSVFNVDILKECFRDRFSKGGTYGLQTGNDVVLNKTEYHANPVLVHFNKYYCGCSPENFNGY